MEEWKRFQGSIFDTFSKRKLIEDRDTILELTAKIQEQQNEVNCMNDSRDFKDVESVRSGLSHVPSQPALLTPFGDPGGMLSRSLGMPSRNDKPPDILGHAWYIGKRFCKSNGVFFIKLSARVQSLGLWCIRTHITTCDEWKPNTSSGSEMPVRTVSQKFIRPLWGKIFKELWGRPITTADFRSSFWQILQANNTCLLEDKIQDWGMYSFTISYGSNAVDQRSGVGWISGWSKIFVFCKRNSNARFWSTRCEDCFSTEQNHP